MSRRRALFATGPKGPADNEIWYTSTDGQIITPSGFTILSNTYRNGVGRIVTNKKITSIPKSAFLNKTTLSSISMVWENITSIGSQAFRSCSNLHQDFHFVNLTSLITLNATASNFYDSGITGFDAPLLTSIPDSCFRGCSSLKSVNIPLVTDIGPGGFRNCSELEEINMESVETIRNYAFDSCSALHQDLYLPKLTSMPASGTNTRHFNGSGITGFDAPLLTSVPSGAFRSCTSLINVNIPSVTSIAGSAFRDCSALASINMESVTTISDYAFNRCSALHQDLHLPNLTTMSRLGTTRTFSSSGITGFDAPILTSVPDNAFYPCASLVNVNIPSVTSIAGSAFRDCSAMQILSLGNTIPSLSTYVFASTPLQHIYVPADTVEEYKADSAWSAYASIISAYPNV